MEQTRRALREALIGYLYALPTKVSMPGATEDAFCVVDVKASREEQLARQLLEELKK